MLNNFAAFILTHGRPNNVKTHATLRKHGYTGRIVVVVDNEDAALPEYRANYGDEVVVFDKPAEAKTTDRGDNFDSLATVLFARNASYKIAKQLGLKYFIQLDDDYGAFEYRYSDAVRYRACPIASLDAVFGSMVEFLAATPAACICMTQGGDFLGGKDGSNANCKAIRLLRKAMNSFLCDADRPIDFLGRLNDDVNTYVVRGSTGQLMLSTTQVSLVQTQTQASAGGLTAAYLEAGTYVKSFYTVMMQPSSVKISAMGDNHMRIHHSVTWAKTVPMILRESVKGRAALE